MGLFSFLGEVGKKIFPTEISDVEKITYIHDEINTLNLPAHISVDVSGTNVTLEGNVADQEVKEKIILAVGNLQGIETITDNIIVPQDNTIPESVFVTVKSGDTLWKISEDAYGDGAKYNLIFQANKPMLHSADAIYVGQQLRIPTLETV
jgi:nucleoid-associated protein YgaU